jgi:hypothetical protein
VHLIKKFRNTEISGNVKRMKTLQRLIQRVSTGFYKKGREVVRGTWQVCYESDAKPTVNCVVLEVVFGMSYTYIV